MCTRCFLLTCSVLFDDIMFQFYIYSFFFQTTPFFKTQSNLYYSDDTCFCVGNKFIFFQKIFFYFIENISVFSTQFGDFIKI